jgi:hypothetical protein
MGQDSIDKTRAGNTILYIMAALLVRKRESGKLGNWENSQWVFYQKWEKGTKRCSFPGNRFLLDGLVSPGLGWRLAMERASLQKVVAVEIILS